MTREEAIAFFKDMNECTYGNLEAVEMAIKALEQEPFINKPCVSSEVCEHDKNVVLDKIRAEIEETYMNITYQENKDRKATWGLRRALQIIDKYKGESEK